jgi:hypothetical protein
MCGKAESFITTLVSASKSFVIFVIFVDYIPNFKSLALTVLEIFCLQTDTQGPMTETLVLGFRDLKTCFGNQCDFSIFSLYMLS